MAIINTSPDSFSGDGIYSADITAVRRRLREVIAQRADILDIGGQSTRPGAEIISAKTEIARVLPAIKLARKLSRTVPISVDTFKPEVAAAALSAGATMLNDVTGFSDRRMVRVAANADCDVVVMHMRGTPQTMAGLTQYPNGVVDDVSAFLSARVQTLTEAGVSRRRIIIDPGIGFAKTAAQSYTLSNQLDAFKPIGCRILYGASNKSFIGRALGRDGQIAPVEDRAVGTIVAQACALLHGADIIRVHDVASAVQTRTIVEALVTNGGSL